MTAEEGDTPQFCLETAQPEQRLHRRYPITVDIEYRLLRQAGFVRSGRTLNISSGGIFFEASASLPIDSEIELELQWPFLLEDVHPLKLVVRGWVVRSDSKGTAVKLTTYEFRIRKRAAIPAGRGNVHAASAT